MSLNFVWLMAMFLETLVDGNQFYQGRYLVIFFLLNLILYLKLTHVLKVVFKQVSKLVVFYGHLGSLNYHIIIYNNLLKT